MTAPELRRVTRMLRLDQIAALDALAASMAHGTPSSALRRVIDAGLAVINGDTEIPTQDETP